MDVAALHEKILEQFNDLIIESFITFNELTLVLARDNLKTLAKGLHSDTALHFDTLIDICGVDYLFYGCDEWETHSATEFGFSRGVEKSHRVEAPQREDGRFAAVYHLLSVKHNHRVRLKVFLEEKDLVIPSVIDIWNAADWFEREAFDLFGIMFQGHPDLRRILTDYGFVGHPFRKDFPLIGKVEARYDGNLGRVVYEPVSIEPRILEPKVIRKDNRYEVGE